MVPDGNWKAYLDKIQKRAQSVIGRFSKRSTVSIDIKLRVAKTLVLSKLSYGAEIICLTKAQEAALDRVQAKVLRAILQLPKNTSARAVRYLTGQTPISAQRRAQRISNLTRIKQLPKETQLRRIYESREWHKKGLVFQRKTKTSFAIQAVKQAPLYQR